MSDEFKYVMSDEDQEAANRLKNEIIDLIYASGHGKLIMYSAVQCAADGLRELIEAQTGCTLEKVNS